MFFFGPAQSKTNNLFVIKKNTLAHTVCEKPRFFLYIRIGTSRFKNILYFYLFE